MNWNPSATVSTDIEADSEKVFSLTVPVDLSLIFKSYSLIPAVVRTDPPSGSQWDRQGLERQVFLADGNTVRETLIKVDNPRYFSYKVFDFSNFIGWFATHAIGEWCFEDRGAFTKVIWKYSFTPKNPIWKPLLTAIATTLFRGYMQQALLILKGHIEGCR